MTANNLDKEYQDIKAGVDGLLSDAPTPSEEETPQTNQEQIALPETKYSESSYQGQPTEYGTTYSEEETPQTTGIDPERIHAIIESVVSEKMDEMLGKVGDLAVWKEKMNNDIIAVKQEVLRTQERFENMQTAILGRVKTYDEGIRNIGSEMKALEKVFERILDPLVTNVKELSQITEDLKKHKK